MDSPSARRGSGLKRDVYSACSLVLCKMLASIATIASSAVFAWKVIMGYFRNVAKDIYGISQMVGHGKRR